jgi:hypothetical protein
MSCCNNCNKNINYLVPNFTGNEDLGTLIASDGIYTSKIYDNCGNLRFDMSCVDCDGGINCDDIARDCSGYEIQIVSLIEISTGSIIPYTGCSQINGIQNAGNGNCWLAQTIDGRRLKLNSITCCSKACDDSPITIEGDLVVNGNITGNTITANHFIGDGCGITNTDDHNIKHFYHDIENDLLVLTSENKKVCPDSDDTSTIFSINTKPFTHNTKNISLEFEPYDSDDLVLTDSDGDKLSVNLEKYNTKINETFVADGNCSDDGLITLDYNPTSPLYPKQVEIDISNAINSLQNGSYDPCTGELTLFNNKGNIIIDNFPKNINAFGQVVLKPEWSGYVYYHIQGNVIMVSINVELSQFTQFPPGNFRPIELGRLPIRLVDYRSDDDLAVNTYTYKYLVSHSSKSMGFINHVQLGIALNGVMRITQWQVPERIQDSFCLVIKDIDKDIIKC